MRTFFSPAFVFLLVVVLEAGCANTNPETPSVPHDEPEAIARTEFTDRVENFFEYEPLRAGQSSQVRIHLTNLIDGSPVENASVTLTVRPPGGPSPLAQVTAKVGKVTGIYVADLSIPEAGTYDIEFHIKNSTLDERLPLSDFKVE